MSTMKTQTECPELSRLVTASADPGAALPNIAQLEEHISGCPVCSAAEEPVARLLARYREHESPPLPAQVEQRLLDKMCRRVR
jgi:hypothetical protein